MSADKFTQKVLEEEKLVIETSEFPIAQSSGTITSFEKQLTTELGQSVCSICQLLSEREGKIGINNDNQKCTGEKSNLNGTTEDEAQQDFKDNPFLPTPFTNELILENIAKYADYPTLKVARNVCSKWNKIFFKRFEKKSNLLVKFDVDQKSISSFMKTFNAAFNDGRVYKTMQFVNPAHLDYSSMNNWMRKYGRFIETLKLGSDYPNDDELRKAIVVSLNTKTDLHSVSLKTIDLLLIQWCPNLKRLCIPIPCAKLDDNHKLDKAYSVNERVVSLSTLELGNNQLDLWSLDDVGPYDVVELFALIIFNRIKSVENVTLKCIENDNQMSDFANSLLVEKNNIPLIESLTSLDLREFTVDPQAFVMLTNLKWTNLKHLKIKTGFTATMFSVDSFTQLSELKNVETLTMYIVDDENLNFALVEVLKRFPGLKDLALDIQLAFFEIDDRNNYDVEELTVYSIKHGIVAAKSLKSVRLAGFKMSVEGYNILLQSQSKFKLELVNCLISTNTF